MRVISGSAKGRPLHAPRGLAVRPTSDKIKGALFSILESLLYVRGGGSEAEGESESVWEGLRWLDLYAGTGALAIEALSRGAAWADLVEASPLACRTCRRNLVETGFAERSRVYCLTVQTAIASDSTLFRLGGYDIIALDPPYADPKPIGLLPVLGESTLLRPGGFLVMEHSRRLELPPEMGQLELVRERAHGDTVLSVYSREEEAV